MSRSNDPLSADLDDDTLASFQPVLRPTKGNLGSGAFSGIGEHLPRVNMEQADDMSRQAQVQNGQEPVILQTVVEILRGFEARFNQIEGRLNRSVTSMPGSIV